MSSAAERYGSIQSLPAATLKEVSDIGQSLKQAGVTGGTETLSAAQKYAAPVSSSSQELGRSLSQKPPGRSL